jgi:hypothetical protein
MKTEQSALILLFPGGRRVPLNELARHHAGRVAKPTVTFVPGRRVATPVTFPGQVAIPIHGDEDHNDPA